MSEQAAKRRAPHRDYEIQARFRGEGFAWEHVVFLTDCSRAEAEEEMGIYIGLHPDSRFRIKVAKP